jgi:C4-dicarboxylate-specific signal transduction histidine kinase
VQLLFADAATGARSHAMVRQGQIGEIIAAKPQARRRILEDAAGIAGLHSRRHEAELRLKAAEENIRRVDDVLNQINEQIDGLTRPTAEHHHIHWKLESCAEDQCRRISAGSSVISALLNLVLNAVEAAGHQSSKQGCSEDGRVECRYAWDADSGLHRWMVRDNGPGPDPAISAKMFEPFVTSKPEGIGLGLPTTALLAKQLGGSLQWHRRGEWTEFEFTIRDSS